MGERNPCHPLKDSPSQRLAGLGWETPTRFDEMPARSIGREAPATRRISLLEGFRLDDAGRAVRLPVGGQRVIAFLALREQPLTRLYVAGTLWVDSSEAHAMASLRTALWRLQITLGGVIRATPTHLSLAPGVAVDLREQHDVIDRVLDDSCELARADIIALAGAGELLPDWYDDWVVVERERVRQVRLHALEAACDRLTACRRFIDAAVAGAAAVSGDPLRESGHRALIRLHLAEGNVQEAIRQYELFARALRRSLGLRPSTLMQELIDGARITAG